MLVVVLHVAILVMGMERMIMQVYSFDISTLLASFLIFMIQILTKAQQTFHLIKSLDSSVPTISYTNANKKISVSGTLPKFFISK